jgi:hypothetical protein
MPQIASSVAIDISVVNQRITAGGAPVVTYRILCENSDKLLTEAGDPLRTE